MSGLHSLYLWLTGPMALTLSLIGLALAGGILVFDGNPAVALAVFGVVIFSFGVLFASFLSTLGVVS